MRNAYALLGFSFLLVFGGAYILLERAEDTSTTEPVLEANYQETMQLSSTAFLDGAMIPTKFSCDGENVNPPLQIAGVPEGTKTLVLLMDDHDIPEAVKERMGIESFDHWVLYNLPADTLEIPAGAKIGETGVNSAGKPAYAGPCPPADQEPYVHRYVFRLYALSDVLQFDGTPTLAEVETMAKEHSLGDTSLVGRYSRHEG